MKQRGYDIPKIIQDCLIKPRETRGQAAIKRYKKKELAAALLMCPNLEVRHTVDHSSGTPRRDTEFWLEANWIAARIKWTHSREFEQPDGMVDCEALSLAIHGRIK